LGLNYSDRD